MWTARQDSRIRAERDVMDRLLPHFVFFFSWSASYVIGREWSAGFRHSYELRLELGIGYPDEEPYLYITCPSLLFDYYGDQLACPSHQFHTLGRREELGWTRLCHSKDWDPRKSCLAVIQRGQLWIHLYEQHLRTGQSIDDMLWDLRRRYTP